MKNEQYIDVKMYAFKMCTQSINIFWLLSAKPWTQFLESTLLMLRAPGLLHNLLISCTPHPKMWNLLCSMNPLILVTPWQAPLLHIYLVIYFFIWKGRHDPLRRVLLSSMNSIWSYHRLSFLSSLGILIGMSTASSNLHFPTSHLLVSFLCLSLCLYHAKVALLQV